MASGELVRAMLWTFGLNYGDKFPVNDQTIEDMVSLWSRHLAVFADEVVEEAVGQVIDEVTYRPQIADVVSRCRMITPPITPTPTQALELPKRDEKAAAEAKALVKALHSRPELQAQVNAAREGMKALLDEILSARQANDVDRINAAEKAIRYAVSPEAYERSRRRTIEAATGRPAEPLTVRKVCGDCHGAGIRKVYRPHGEMPSGYILVDNLQSVTGYWKVYCQCQTVAGRQQQEQAVTA